MAGSTDARRLVDAHADVTVLSDLRLTGVQAHANLDGFALRPLVSGEVSLDGDSRVDRVLCPPEGDEEGVALGVHLAPVVRSHRGADQALML